MLCFGCDIDNYLMINAFLTIKKCRFIGLKVSLLKKYNRQKNEKISPNF
jgi:hypothetical protein